MLAELVSEISRWAIPALLFFIPLYGWLRRVKVYEAFTEGAEQGFHIAVRIIPYLIGILVAISVFRASGAMEVFVWIITPIMKLIGVPPEVVPLAVMRPLSGGGALGIATELINQYGPDSFIGRLASVMQGSTDTTFYVLTVYFGAVGVLRYRYALMLGLTADIVGFLASLYICHLMFM